MSGFVTNAEVRQHCREHAAHIYAVLRACAYLVQAHALFGRHFTDASCSKRRLIFGCDDRRCWGLSREAECRSYICSRLAAQARVAGKGGIHEAAKRGDMAAVQDHLIADASCLNQPESSSFCFSFRYDWTSPTPACTAVFAMLTSFSIRRTALHMAASEGHVHVVQLLLS